MKFRYALLHRSVSYWLILGFFSVINLWTWLRHRVTEPACCDQLASVGFPFPFHVSGGIAGRDDLLVTGLLLDGVIAWTLAVIAAWIALLIKPASKPGSD